MWITGIIGQWIVGVLIAVWVIGLVWHVKWFAPRREGAQAATIARPSKEPRTLKPRTPEDCPTCRGEQSPHATSEAQTATARGGLTPYGQVKSPWGCKKRLSTAGYACPNPSCAYF